jgi:hypothetical protein
MGVQAEQCHCLQLGCALQKRGLGSRNGPFGNKLAALCNARLGNIVCGVVVSLWSLAIGRDVIRACMYGSNGGRLLI